MPKIRKDIIEALSKVDESQDIDQLVELLGGEYTRRKISEALKWLVPDTIQAEKGWKKHGNRYFLPKRLQPSTGVAFDQQTESLAKKLKFDLSGPIGWQFQMQAMITTSRRISAELAQEMELADQACVLAAETAESAPPAAARHHRTRAYAQRQRQSRLIVRRSAQKRIPSVFERLVERFVRVDAIQFQSAGKCRISDRTPHAAGILRTRSPQSMAATQRPRNALERKLATPRHWRPAQDLFQRSFIAGSVQTGPNKPMIRPHPRPQPASPGALLEISSHIHYPCGWIPIPTQLAEIDQCQSASFQQLIQKTPIWNEVVFR